jgi:hypothetical protein
MLFPCAHRLSVMVALAWLSASCGGDQRAIYVGNYATSTLAQTTSGGQTTNSTFTGSLVVSEAADRTRIVLDDGQCPLTAVVSGNSFAVDIGVTCNTNGMSTTGATCNIAITWTSGSGTRSPGAISIQLAGNQTFSCSDGSTGTGTVSESITGTQE